MGFLYADTLEKHEDVGTDAYSIAYHVTPTLILDLRLLEHQEREPGIDGLRGRLICVKEYEEPALVAQWIQQLSSAIEFVEKMGFCHNDLRAGNCLLDKDCNLKLIDFGRVTPIGQLLEGVSVPLAILTQGGPFSGSYGLCGARTEQFAVGSMLYFMVYGHEADDDPNVDRLELCERFNRKEFPDLNRHEVFDELISACWHNVWPTMALLAYKFQVENGAHHRFNP
ncbi:serine/threonine protein kinase [Helicocarpus griseus UAMH5409]|uniref:EKC/KEOPS complex subunit BUD32 n=1 Tax=Helicocarpus griseus UAMH5409 TaxID=1447875 RepID=A0A2B7XLV1_9EURO|nr:serine/threonine protein kinase [Helicocarpus griseus UAMH5409]